MFARKEMKKNMHKHIHIQERTKLKRIQSYDILGHFWNLPTSILYLHTHRVFGNVTSIRGREEDTANFVVYHEKRNESQRIKCYCVRILLCAHVEKQTNRQYKRVLSVLCWKREQGRRMTIVHICQSHMCATNVHSYTKRTIKSGIHAILFSYRLAKLNACEHLLLIFETLTRQHTM